MPKQGELYKIEFGDKMKPFVQNLDKDPVWKAVHDIAREAEISSGQLNKFLPKLMEKMVEGGLVEAPVDAQAQLRSLAPAGNYANDQEKDTAAAKRMSNNTAWVDQSKAQGVMPADVADFFAAGAASDPRAHKAIEWLRGAAHEPRPAMEAGKAAGGLTAEQLKARNIDPRNNPQSQQYDEAFAAETQRLFQLTY